MMDGTNDMKWFAALKGDGSYDVSGVNLKPGKGQITLPNGSTVSVGSGGQLVVNELTVQPSVIPTSLVAEYSGGNTDTDDTPATQKSVFSTTQGSLSAEPSKRNAALRHIPIAWSIILASLGVYSGLVMVYDVMNV
ncbi:hypothetical protein BT63DRAFT_422852 [Microthyrium microscopicum]|uniref:Uncharacterized protein n=1 Tax=Microthyrium microscopicum TaxID=703497 RepID=A0A6A6ULJ1_9PEZI|nr:hypothetical protein BT63DRAFT_422852 [Microthyrium microscopicum]